MKRALAFGALCLATLGPSDTAAFTIRTGFSDGCHERFATEAFTQSLSTLPTFPDEATPDDDWEGVAAAYLRENAELPRGMRFFLHSLVLGARAPDTEGHSITNAQALRAAQADPGSQYPHCLRGADDDYAAGDASALSGCRRELVASVQRAIDAVVRSEGERADEIREIYVTLDGYGAFETKVWIPAYQLGRALHTLQDSFSHSLRDTSMHRVVHVMNYEAPLSGHAQEARDGLAHSLTMDRCRLPRDPTERALEAARYAATVEASAQLLGLSDTLVASSAAGPEATLDLLDEVLDAWLTPALPSDLGAFDACTIDNDYCASPWLSIARRAPTTPLLFCAAAPGRGGTGRGVLGWGLALAAVLATRGRNRRRRAGRVGGS